MRFLLFPIVFACAVMSARMGHSQDQVAAGPTEQADLDQLRALRESLTKAVIAGDIEAQLSHADDHVLTVWQNSAVARGKQGVRDLMAEVNAGGEKVFQGYRNPPASDDQTRIYGGDTAIASGTSTPHYKWMGLEFDLENRWTATLVKQGGEWKLASYHVSANIFDNPMLNAAKGSNAFSGLGGLVLGLVAGWFGSRMIRKTSK